MLIISLALIALGVLSFGGWLYLRQDSLIFRPSPTVLRTPASIGIQFEELYLPIADDLKVHAWWAAGEAGRAIIFFHGQAGNLMYELISLHFLRATGHGVLMIEYPGYGKSGGRPSERGCYQAAEAAWSFLRSAGFDEQEIVLFGRSLGTAVATYLASQHPCGGLVFHSGFASIPEAAARTYPFLPVRLFCRTKMNSLRTIARVRCPLLLLHSETDEVHPLAEAQQVYRNAPGPKRLVRYSGTHHSNDWQRDPQVRAALGELLSGTVEHWEQQRELVYG